MNMIRVLNLLSSLVRITASDYPVGIIKLFISGSRISITDY